VSKGISLAWFSRISCASLSMHVCRFITDEFRHVLKALDAVRVGRLGRCVRLGVCPRAEQFLKEVRARGATENINKKHPIQPAIAVTDHTPWQHCRLQPAFRPL
jgi:hypothetical protein